MADWLSDGRNWAFLALAVVILGSGFRVVTSRNVVHAALFLVATLGGSAGLFLLLAAEFVAWVLVLVYIGAVLVLFLFGVMITRAPLGYDVSLDHPRRWPAALVALAVFGVMASSTLLAFGSDEVTLAGADDVVRSGELGDVLFSRFVFPFEVVSFVLLAALIGGIALARRDPET